MSKLEQPELTKQDQRIKDYILPRLNADLGEYEEATDKNIDVTKSILAQEYKKTRRR